MSDVGFINDKLEIKFLILYIAARIVGPVSFEALQDIAMCDEGVDYFDFAECLADLVASGHIDLEDSLYSITEKGRQNSAICESSLPYSVRMRAEEALVETNEKLKRRALVGAAIRESDSGGYIVTLSLRDELDELLKMDLMVTRKDMAVAIQKRFRRDAESLYGEILNLLFKD